MFDYSENNTTFVHANAERRKTAVKILHKMEVKTEWLNWLAGSDTGISSKTMFSAITGIPVGCADIPYDMADVGRCVRMLRQLPDLRPQLGKVVEKHKEWMPFIDCWKQLERLYDECIVFEHMPEADRSKLKKAHQHFTSPNNRAWELIQQIVMASRYLKGWRMQNCTSSWMDKAPEAF